MCAAKADWIADEKDESGITCTNRVICCSNDTGNASQCVPARQLLICVWIHYRGKQRPSVAQPCSRCVLPWKKDNKLNPLKSISSSPSAESQLRFSMVIEDFAIKSNPSHESCTWHECEKVIESECAAVWIRSHWFTVRWFDGSGRQGQMGGSGMMMDGRSSIQLQQFHTGKTGRQMGHRSLHYRLIERCHWQHCPWALYHFLWLSPVSWWLTQSPMATLFWQTMTDDRELPVAETFRSWALGEI